MKDIILKYALDPEIIKNSIIGGIIAFFVFILCGIFFVDWKNKKEEE